MDKNQKILLGLAVVGVGGYLLWKSKQPKATFMRADGCPAGSVVVNGTGNNVNRAYCMDTKTQRLTKRLNADGLKGIKGLGKLTNRKSANGLDLPTKLTNRKKMVGMINSDKVQDGPFMKKGFTAQNLNSDLLSVKNSNFFDQNVLASKF